jgi:hypothetical protein
MTPVLLGRWETRIAMLATLGLLITALFALGYDDSTFFEVLFYVGLFGIGWDVVYIALQQLRWDRDWPAAFQVATGIWEGVFLYLVIDNIGLPGIEEGMVPMGRFIAHYGLVWLSIFVWVQGPMRAVFPFWRFHGGRII